MKPYAALSRHTAVMSATVMITAGLAAGKTAPRPVGSGVLVSESHVITALHNLVGLSDSNIRFSVCFPALPGKPSAAIKPACVLRCPELDLAVITLDEDLVGLPAPLHPSRGARLPNRAEAFGFPITLGAIGMWCSFVSPRPLPSGHVQWTCEGPVGALKGHSGGPVVHAKYPLLLGILVQGAEALGFDTMLPVRRIAACWSGFRLPWLFFGSEGRLGHRPEANAFLGRSKALGKIRTWIEASESPSEVLVITGQPGGGKSAVLREAAFAAERLLPGNGLVFDAHGATRIQMLKAIAELMDLTSHRPEDILQEALDTNHGRTYIIMVDALDEAAKGHRRMIAQTLVQLAQVPVLRVIVATRRVATDTDLDLDGFLKLLGVNSPTADNLIDLDTDDYFDGQALADYTRELLAHEPDGFWEPDQRNRVADAVVARAGRNFLVAELAANSLAGMSVAIDLRQTDELDHAVPDSVEEAVAKYLVGLGQNQKDLLKALAFARGPGVTDSLWLGFAQALGFNVNENHLAELRESGAASYLVESTSDKGQRVTRLFHQALVDHLLKEDRTFNEEKVFGVILHEVRSAGGWGKADEYARTYAAEHGLFAGTLLKALDDPAFVINSDLDRLVASINHLSPSEQPPMAVVVLRAAGRAADLKPRARARLLALAAAHLGLPKHRDALIREAGGGLMPVWAHSLGQPHQELLAHAGAVLDVQIGELGGRSVVASAHARGSLLVWDENGDPQFGPLRRHAGAARSAAIGSFGGRSVVASGGDDGGICFWDSNGEPIDEPLATNAGLIQGLAIGRLGGYEVIAAAGSDRSVRVWGSNREPVFTCWHDGSVQSVAIGHLHGQDVVVSGGNDCKIRVWDELGDLILGPLHYEGGEVHAVAIGELDGSVVIVAGGQDGVVRVWNSNGDKVAQLRGHTNWIQSVAIGRIGEDQVIASASVDTTVRIWNSRYESVGQPLFGHDKGINAIALGRLGAKSVVASASRDETVRIWDPRSESIGMPERDRDRVAVDAAGDAAQWEVPAPEVGHTGAVHALAVGHLAGEHRSIVSAGFDSSVRVWNERGKPLGRPLMGQGWGINSIAIGQLGDQTAIVAGGFDNSVQAWSAIGGDLLWRIRYAHMASVNGVAVGSFDNRDVVVSCSDDGTVKLWNSNGGNIGDPWKDGYDPRIFAVALGKLRGQQVIVSGSEDGYLRIWNTCRDLILRSKVHPGPVRAVVLGRLDGRDVIVTAGGNTVCLLSDDGSPMRVLRGHIGDVTAVAIGTFRGQDVIVTTGRDCTVRIWDESGNPIGQPFPLLEEARGTALHPAGILVATGPALVLLSKLSRRRVATQTRLDLN